MSEPKIQLPPHPPAFTPSVPPTRLHIPVPEPPVGGAAAYDEAIEGVLADDLRRLRGQFADERLLLIQIARNTTPAQLSERDAATEAYNVRPQVGKGRGKH